MNYFKKDGYVYELTQEAKAFHFKVESSVSAETIENIIVDSLEAQSTYWVGIDNTTEEWNNQPDGLPTSQYATQLLLEGKTVVLFDIEDETERWELDLSKLLNGIGVAMSKGYDIENCADEVLQMALFGDLVYS